MAPHLRSRLRFLTALTVLAAVGYVLWPTESSGQQATGDEPPLPENVVVDVDMIESQVFLMGIPDLLGTAPYQSEAGGILRNDFLLMPAYRVIPVQQIRHDLEAEGLGMQQSRWGALNAKGVIKGRVTGSGNLIQVEMKFYMLGRGATPAFEKTYSGRPNELRGWMHDFANEVIRVHTGRAGPFGTHITWASRVGPGRKDVMCGGMDGHSPHRVTNGRGITMLPSFAGTDIWFTRLTQSGMFITRTGIRGRPIISGNGLNMAPTVCGDRVFFTSSRHGNSEIYSARTNGSDVRRLTNHPAIDVSPACGPNDKVAFVSARHGNPQIWMMNADGSGQRRVTYKGNHNQTPALCQDRARPLLAFTGRDNTLDVFTLNLATNEYTRVTQGQGMNKDPAWSPDCRIVAFASDRRRGEGIYLASPLGFNQNRVVEGAAETVRWSQQPVR
jgi:TolB protein